MTEYGKAERALPDPAGEGIPHLIHQIWKTDAIPGEWRGFARSWRLKNPEWEYRLWSDVAVEAYIDERYPLLSARYRGLSYDIQRADLARYLILHGIGGVYADLDVECLRPLSELVAGRRFLACSEPIEHARVLAGSEIIGNALLASVPGHRLLESLVREIDATASSITFHQEVLASTGPDMLDRVIRAYRGEDLTILDSRVAYPYANRAPELALLQHGGRRAEELRERLIGTGTWAVHYWANSWVRNLAGELRNPRPDAITGYRFYQGRDSHGHDLANGGRDIELVARRCSEMEGALAFNTDGFIKYRVRTRIAWSRVPNAAWNEGLYVRQGSGTGLRRAIGAIIRAAAAMFADSGRHGRR